ncbi:hypothetical protein Peur_065726 [Populus x canadensis]
MCPPKPLNYKGCRIQIAHSNIVVVYVQGASARKNVCHRACRTCCMKCRRVPPGTYGNKCPSALEFYTTM